MVRIKQEAPEKEERHTNTDLSLKPNEGHVSLIGKAEMRTLHNPSEDSVESVIGVQIKLEGEDGTVHTLLPSNASSQKMVQSFLGVQVEQKMLSLNTNSEDTTQSVKGEQENEKRPRQLIDKTNPSVIEVIIKGEQDGMVSNTDGISDEVTHLATKIYIKQEPSVETCENLVPSSLEGKLKQEVDSSTPIPSTSSDGDRKDSEQASTSESADQINVQSLHVDLMQALSKDNPNQIKVLKILDDVDKINSLNPSLLQAHPDFVKTIKQVCKYKFSDTVRERALSLFNKLKLISQQGTTDIADQVPNEDNECDDDDDSDEDYTPSSSKADLFDGDTRIMRSHTRRCLQDNAEPKQGYKQLKKSATVEAVEQIPLSKALEEKRKTSVKKKPYRYCIFCHKMKSCLRKHMETQHKENERVRDALMKSKKLRDELFDKFRKEGILLFNKEESKKDNPKYLRERACQPENEKDQIVMCSVCHGFYRKIYLRKHMAKCKTHEPIRGAPIPMSLLSMNTSDQSVFAQEVLAKFRKSEVSTICKTDKVLLTIGRRLWEKKRKKINKDDNRKSVMTDMRRLGRLYLAFRKTEDTLGELPIKRGDISDVFQRENWVHLEQAVESCTIKEDGKTIKVALKLGLLYLIRNACKILKGTYLIQDEDSRAEDIDKFLSVLDLNQSYLFGDATYHVNKKRKSKLRRPSESRKEHVSQHFQHAGETNKNVYQAPLTMRELDVVGHRLDSIHEDGVASIVPVSEITHHDEILPPRDRAEVQAFLNTQVNFPHDLKTVQTKLKNEARKIKKRTVKKRKTLQILS